MTKSRIMLIISFVALLALVALPAAAQSYPNPGQGSTYTELANKTTTAATANVTYYDATGAPLAGPSPSIPGNGSVGISPSTSQLPQGFNGAGVVSSNQPLASVVSTRWTGGAGGDGFEVDMYTGVPAGASKSASPASSRIRRSSLPSLSRTPVPPRPTSPLFIAAAQATSKASSMTPFLWALSTPTTCAPPAPRFLTWAWVGTARPASK